MRLFTKGLLLIAIPGIVEVALLGAVFGTQKEAAQAAHAAEASKQILWQASSLADPLLREAARVRTAIVLDDASFIDRHAVWTEFADRLALLARLVADNPAQLARVDHMRAAAYAWRTQAADVAEALRAGRSVAWAANVGAALPPQIETVRTELAEFIAAEAQLDTQRSAASGRKRALQRGVLIAAVVGSMLIWAFAAAVFARNIGVRLATLDANARRIGEGMPLARTLSGNDEIAALDAVLHDTARRLREAAEQQSALKDALQTRAAELGVANEHLRHETQDNEMFIYSVSHDLRSPLVNLQGFSAELQGSCDELRAHIAEARLPAGDARRMARVLDGDLGEALQFLRQAVTRAAGIIDALLRISRAGRLDYRARRVAIERIVARAIESVRGGATGAGVQITVHALPPAWGDPSALEQVFASLIDNALRYLDPARRGEVEVGALEGAVSSTRTRTYFVRDNGVGIAADSIPKLFHAFQRLHGHDAQTQGVGLALVRRIVERHGGRVWVDSVEGTGSTFFVMLPEQPLRMP